MYLLFKSDITFMQRRLCVSSSTIDCSHNNINTILFSLANGNTLKFKRKKKNARCFETVGMTYQNADSTRRTRNGRQTFYSFRLQNYTETDVRWYVKIAVERHLNRVTAVQLKNDTVVTAVIIA